MVFLNTIFQMLKQIIHLKILNYTILDCQHQKFVIFLLCHNEPDCLLLFKFVLRKSRLAILIVQVDFLQTVPLTNQLINEGVTLTDFQSVSNIFCSIFFRPFIQKGLKIHLKPTFGCSVKEFGRGWGGWGGGAGRGSRKSPKSRQILQIGSRNLT